MRLNLLGLFITALGPVCSPTPSDAEILPGVYKRGVASVELYPYKRDQLSGMIFVNPPSQASSGMCAWEGTLRSDGNGGFCSFNDKECLLCVEGASESLNVRVVQGCQNDCGSTSLSFNLTGLHRSSSHK